VRKFIVVLSGILLLFAMPANAADFNCAADIPKHEYTPQEQKLVDQYWSEVLIYLDAYLTVLEKPSGQCRDSAEATIQTFQPSTGKPQSRCILRYRDVELVAKHLKAVLDNPEGAKACFDPQKSQTKDGLYTPSVKVQQLSQVSEWLDRPLLTKFYKDLGGEIGDAGVLLNDNFIAITKKTETEPHWPTDISINGLKTLWSSVGWIPMYSKREDAVNKPFRGGYLYAEVMGPAGALRIDTIDGELVGAEIGLTVQLFNTAYPFHHHNPQEIYITLTKPACVDQNKYALMHWDNPALVQQRGKDGWNVFIDGSGDEWKKWFIDLNPTTGWLAYIERNAVHAFYSKEDCNQTIENSGLVTSWARTTARTANQDTDVCHAMQPGTKALAPWTPVVCHAKDWAR
jgi:hypothetical protein